MTGYQDVFEFGVPKLVESVQRMGDLTKAIVFTHIAWMAKNPDSLIARKCGIETAKQSQILSQKASDCFDEDSQESFWSAVGELDFWLRSDGHRRNPGTTADLIAASLYVGICNGDIVPPFR